MSHIAGLYFESHARRAPSIWTHAFVLGLALSSHGCATGANAGAAVPVAKFPTQQSLNEIAAQPSQPIKQEPVYRVAQWSPTQTAQTAAAPDAPAEPPDRWTALFNEVAAQHPQVTVVAALSCAAKEFAQVVAAHGAVPDRRAQQFIEGACGSSTPLASTWYSTTKVPDSESDADLYSASVEKLKPSLDAQLARGRLDAGFALVRANGVATLVTLTAEHTLDGVRTPIIADASGRALIEGTVAHDVRYVQAYINQGQYDSRECVRDTTVALPKFRVWCPMQPGDATAWADVEIVEPDRILGNIVGQLLVRAAPDSELKYDAPNGSVSATDTGDLRQKLLTQINALRQSAGSTPLRSADRQVVTNDRLAPHFFSADSADKSEVEESIMLGLVAGWNVSGLIRNGDFFSELLGGTNDVTDLVSSLYDQPAARHVLMARDARQIAIGSLVLPNAGGIGVVITTYSFFETNDHHPDELALFERINAARRARHLPPATRLDDAPLRKAVEEIQQGTNPEDALHRAARRSMRSGFSLLLQATDLRQLQIPSELLENRPEQVTLAITHYRAPGGAWGQYVVLLLVS